MVLIGFRADIVELWSHMIQYDPLLQIQTYNAFIFFFCSIESVSRFMNLVYTDLVKVHNK